MMVQHAVPDRSMDQLSTEELDWDALYADLAPRVYNYFRYRMGSQADVEELTSRTFERAWRSRSHYRHDLAGFSTWLFKIAQNADRQSLYDLEPGQPGAAVRSHPDHGPCAEHTRQQARRQPAPRTWM